MFADVKSIACTALPIVRYSAGCQRAHVRVPPCVSHDRMHRDTFMQPTLNSSGAVGDQAQGMQDGGLPHESSRRRSVMAPHPGRRSSRATRGSLTAFQIARSYLEQLLQPYLDGCTKWALVTLSCCLSCRRVTKLLACLLQRMEPCKIRLWCTASSMPQSREAEPCRRLNVRGCSAGSRSLGGRGARVRGAPRTGARPSAACTPSPASCRATCSAPSAPPACAAPARCCAYLCECDVSHICTHPMLVAWHLPCSAPHGKLRAFFAVLMSALCSYEILSVPHRWSMMTWCRCCQQRA